MATLRATIKDVLATDAPLLVLLTGGVKDASDFDQGGESLEDAPKEDDGIRIKPHGVLRWSGAQATGYATQQLEYRYLHVWLYTHSGYSTLEAAKARIKKRLDGQPFTADDTGLAWLRHAGDLGEFVAEELGNAAADRVRFQILTERK